MKRKIIAVFAVMVLVGIGLRAFATTALYNLTIRIVDSSGTVISGTASATSALYNQTVRVVNSSGKVLDSFGSLATLDGVVTGSVGSNVFNSTNSSGNTIPANRRKQSRWRRRW